MFTINYKRFWKKKSLLLPKLRLGRRHLSFKDRFKLYTYMIKALSNNIWKLSCSLHKRRNSPTFIMHVQWQWKCKALTFAYQIEPKTTLRWHKSIFLKKQSMFVSLNQNDLKIFEKILIKMSILRTALRIIKWNRIPTFKH